MLLLGRWVRGNPPFFSHPSPALEVSRPIVHFLGFRASPKIPTSDVCLRHAPKCSFKMIGFSFEMAGFSFKMIGFSFKMVGFSFKMAGFSFKISVCLKMANFGFKMAPSGPQMANLSFKGAPGRVWRKTARLPLSRKKNLSKKIRLSFWKIWLSEPSK